MDEDNLTSPSSLEDSAIKVAFKEILSNLILCHDHRPKEKKLNWLPCSSLLATIPYLESEQLLVIVRSRLDHYLEGIMGDTIRKKFVEMFYQGVQQEYSVYSDDSDCSNDEADQKDHKYDNKERKEECFVDLWAFLDCVLDNSFKELEMHVAFPGCEPNPKLIQTIVKRSPLLEKLELDFSLMKTWTKINMLKPMFSPLAFLEHLTELRLLWLKELNKDVKLRPTLLNLVGKSCPLLSTLVVLGGRVFTKKEIYGLFVGDLVQDTIPRGSETAEWFEDYEFSRLKVPEKILVPMCFTLKELRLDDDVDRGSSTFEKYGASAIFILRHLPVLEELSLPLPTAVAIKSLYGQSQVQFEILCEKATQRRIKESSQPNFKSSFTGSLSLTTIGAINTLDKDMLQAVGYFCPLMKDVLFKNPYTSNNDLPKDFLSPDGLEAVLSGWPKLTKISIWGLKSELVKSILKVLGPDLVDLNISFRSELNIQDLLSCPKLESLTLWGDDLHILNPAEKDPLLSPATFLPQLRKLDCRICLGVWSNLFEWKPNLVRLSLSCCHIGCRVEESRNLPSKRLKSASEVCTKESEWNQIPQMWPRLEYLEIRSCAGLTMAMIGNLVPQFRKLKSISLPYKLRSNEPHLSRDVRNQLSLQRPQIQLFYYLWNFEKICPFIDEYEKAEKEAINSKNRP